MFWSTLLAALPIIVLLGGIGIFHMKAHVAALLGLIVALVVAVIGFGMPAPMAGAAAVYGAAFGLLPIRSEEHTSELHSLLRISYAAFFLTQTTQHNNHIQHISTST